MARKRRRRRGGRQPAALRRYWATHRRKGRRSSYRRRRRHSIRVSGRHRLFGRASVRRRTFTLKRRSPFKRRMRGYRINPHVAEYLMNPRRRRRSGRRRMSYRSNPMGGGVVKAMTGVFDVKFIMQGAVATGGLLGTITIGNMALAYVAPYAPVMMQTGYLGIATKAAVRSAVAWALDRYVVSMVTRDHSAFRVGATIGIVGSAVLEVLGKALLVGQGDSAQSIQSFVPAGVAAYIPKVSGGVGRRQYGTRAYVPRVHGLEATDLSGLNIGNEAHMRLYGSG